jgi:hypothetical protein
MDQVRDLRLGSLAAPDGPSMVLEADEVVHGANRMDSFSVSLKTRKENGQSDQECL